MPDRVDQANPLAEFATLCGNVVSRTAIVTAERSLQATTATLKRFKNAEMKQKCKTRRSEYERQEHFLLSTCELHGFGDAGPTGPAHLRLRDPFALIHDNHRERTGVASGSERTPKIYVQENLLTKSDTGAKSATDLALMPRHSRSCFGENYLQLPPRGLGQLGCSCHYAASQLAGILRDDREVILTYDCPA